VLPRGSDIQQPPAICLAHRFGQCGWNPDIAVNEGGNFLWTMFSYE